MRTLIEAALRSELGCEPDETSVIHLLFLLPSVEGEAVEVPGSSDEVYTVAGGTSRLVDALGAALGEQIQLRHVLTREEQRGQTYTLPFEGQPCDFGHTIRSEEHRRQGDFQFIDDTEVQVLLDHLRAARDANIATARSLSSLLKGALRAVVDKVECRPARSNPRFALLLSKNFPFAYFFGRYMEFLPHLRPKDDPKSDISPHSGLHDFGMCKAFP